jgi:beta-phosphoglucomutase-like phosphatase (HAD superfamily)
LAELISHLPLEELLLDSVTMHRDVMTDMLEGLGSTLRRLEITDCYIFGSWKHILLTIQQHAAKLEKLNISTIWRSWLEGSVEYEGIDEVRSGVEKLLQARQMVQDGIQG